MARTRLRLGSFGGTSRVGDIVRHAGTDYICRRQTNLSPPDPEYWQPAVIRDAAFDVEGPPGRDSVVPGPPGKDSTIPGPPGPPGKDAVGFNWKGAFRHSRTYSKNDVVEHEGSTWICTAESTRREPNELSRHWDLFTARGRDGVTVVGPQGARGRPGENQTLVIENGDPPSIAVFDSDTARGDVLYVAETGHVDLAQANGEPQATAVGIALASVASGFAGTYQTTGPVSNPAWNLTPGAVYYLSPTVAGGMTETFPNTPGDYVVILGAALSETELNLNIHWALVIGS